MRIHDVSQGIEDLAENIRAVGLLQPVAVYFDSSASIYMLLTGQRRLQAYHYNNERYPDEGYDKILCRVIDDPKTDEKKKALSLAENITQLPMTDSDLIRAVTDLYNVYGDYDIVKQEFGITSRMVDKYVKLSRLPERIKEAVENGEIHSSPPIALNMALKAVTATSYTRGGDVPEQKVIDLATEMAKSENIATDLAKAAEQGGSVPEIVERSKKIPKNKLKIDLSKEIAEKLRKVAEASGETEVAMAFQYIETGVNRDFGQLDD